MSNQAIYGRWSETYDTVENKTRDLERVACRQVLSTVDFREVIELGCGTGKNTVWLAERAVHVTAVDFSPEMQAIAREKAFGSNVDFALADITQPWDFAEQKADLVTASLVLEHIEDLDAIFAEAAAHLHSGGSFYVCELHPFRQYAGSKARFELEGKTTELECTTHHVSDYTDAAKGRFEIERLGEWFDEGARTGAPRLISFLFRRL